MSRRRRVGAGESAPESRRGIDSKAATHVKAQFPMGRHGTTTNGHRKGEYYLGQRASKHMQRKFDAGDVADRFVLPPAEPATKKLTRKANPHPNAKLVNKLRNNELRACYRATFHEDPGQMGKDKILEAFLKPKAPRARVPKSYAPGHASIAEL